MKRLYFYFILLLGVAFLTANYKQKALFAFSSTGLSNLSFVSKILNANFLRPNTVVAENEGHKKNSFVLKIRNSLSSGEQDFVFSVSPYSKSKTFEEVLSFIKKSQNHLGDYVLDESDCKHYAQKLFNSAQRAGIESEFVTIELANRKAGHAVVAFPTSDYGRVFVDFTPLQLNDISRPRKAIVMVKENSPYYAIPLNELSPFFVNTEQDFVEHSNKVKNTFDSMGELELKKKQLIADLEAHDQKISEFKRSPAKSESQAVALNGKSSMLNERLNEIKSIEKNLNTDFKDSSYSLPASWVVRSFALYPKNNY